MLYAPPYHRTAMIPGPQRGKVPPALGRSAKQQPMTLAQYYALRAQLAAAGGRPVLPPENQPCSTQQISKGCVNGSDSGGNTKCVCPPPKTTPGVRQAKRSSNPSMALPGRYVAAQGYPQAQATAGQTVSAGCPATHYFNGSRCVPRAANKSAAKIKADVQRAVRANNPGGGCSSCAGKSVPRLGNSGWGNKPRK
jgi:hypothetical protein